MIGLFLRPIRRRKAIAAMAAYSEARDAFYRARSTGDTRKMNETRVVLQYALNASLKADEALRRVGG
jgi:hypothetical protein